MIYIAGMSKTAKLFRNGRSQAVRLPREFRFEGDEVLIRQVGNGVLLEPKVKNVLEWFAKLDDFKGEFMKKGDRQQPQTPSREIFD
jgi:antitoxin VapB